MEYLFFGIKILSYIGMAIFLIHSTAGFYVYLGHHLSYDVRQPNNKIAYDKFIDDNIKFLVSCISLFILLTVLLYKIFISASYYLSASGHPYKNFPILLTLAIVCLSIPKQVFKSYLFAFLSILQNSWYPAALINFKNNLNLTEEVLSSKKEQEKQAVVKNSKKNDANHADMSFGFQKSAKIISSCNRAYSFSSQLKFFKEDYQITTAYMTAESYKDFKEIVTNNHANYCNGDLLEIPDKELGIGLDNIFKNFMIESELYFRVILRDFQIKFDNDDEYYKHPIDIGDTSFGIEKIIEVQKHYTLLDNKWAIDFDDDENGYDYEKHSDFVFERIQNILTLMSLLHKENKRIN